MSARETVMSSPSSSATAGELRAYCSLPGWVHVRHDDLRRAAVNRVEVRQSLQQELGSQVPGLQGHRLVFVAERHLGEQHVRGNVVPRVANPPARVARVEQGHVARHYLETGCGHGVRDRHRLDSIAQHVELLVEVDYVQPKRRLSVAWGPQKVGVETAVQQLFTDEVDGVPESRRGLWLGPCRG